MKFRKPELIPLLFIIFATLVLTTLGAWQVQRLQWKNALTANIEKAQAEETLGNLPENVDGLAYRNVILSGRFINDTALRLVGRKSDMGAGFFVLTPFVLEDDGRVILVNRGYAETGKENPVDGLQTIQGILRPPREKRPFAPDNQQDKNLWFYENISAISSLIGRPLLPYVIEATGTDKRTQPIVSDGKISMRNDHLGYAITWFSLAIVGLVMFAFYQRIPENKA
ncbi:MAG: SURF1 family protein [Alphaproteobacteria bacterium]